MLLNNFQYDMLMRIYDKKRLNNKRKQYKRIQKIYKIIPDIKNIDNKITSLNFKKIKLLLSNYLSYNTSITNIINKLLKKKRNF